MDTFSLRFLLSVCLPPTIVIDRNFSIIGQNCAADRMDFDEGGNFLSTCSTDAGSREAVASFFKSTNKKRLRFTLPSSGEQVEAMGWRLAGPFRNQTLAMIQLLDIATARTHFVVTAKDLHHTKQSQKLRAENSKLVQTNERLGRLATLDQATGLLNSATFRTAIVSQIEQNEGFSLFYMDLNGLKEINDRHGHLAGNEAIADFAKAVKKCIRKSDLGARLGGDEFAILATGNNNKSNMFRLAKRIQDALRDSPVSRKYPTKHEFKVAIGVSRWPKDAQDADALEALADAAMYKSKREQSAIAFAEPAKRQSDDASPCPKPSALPKAFAKTTIAKAHSPATPPPQ